MTEKLLQMNILEYLNEVAPDQFSQRKQVLVGSIFNQQVASGHININMLGYLKSGLKDGQGIGISFKLIKQKTVNFVNSCTSSSKLALFGLIFVGVIVIGGVSYQIYKKIKSHNLKKENLQIQQLKIQLEQNLKQKGKNQKDKMCWEQLSSSSLQFDQILSLTSSQIEKYEQIYRCPISCQIMINPVLTICCGNSYDKQGILQQIKRRGKCPKCRKQINQQSLIPNLALKQSILLFQKGLRKKKVNDFKRRLKQDQLQ